MSCTTLTGRIPDDEIVAGSLNPYAIRYVVTSDDPTNFDLTTVTAARFEVKRGNGEEDSWTGLVLSGATTTSLTLDRALVATDVPVVDTLVIVPILTVPSGEFIGEARVVSVIDKFAKFGT